MKKRIYTIIAALFLGLTAAQAQNETSVTVTDASGHEEQIDLPQSMSEDLDSLMLLYNSSRYLRPDSDCNMPDVNPVYEPEVYKERLAKLPTIIEMPYNSIVQAFIDRYAGELRPTIAYILGAQNFYIPIFEEALDSYGLPLELKYLPVIESALNPRAVSRAGAVGLWQFMLKTAHRYDLTVNSLVDERRDVIRSSYAAARYLRDLYKLYGDWNLVIAAYNCGPDKISKAIRRSHGERDYWKIYPHLPRETRGYVPAFIAANYIMTYYCDHNICPMNSSLPEATDTVMVNRDVHFQQVAQVLGLSVDQLRDLNPQYKRDVVNGRAGLAALRLPASAINAFIDNEDSIYRVNADELLHKRTEVQMADNYMVKNNTVVMTSSRSDKASSRSSKERSDEAAPSASNALATVSDVSTSDSADEEETVTRSSSRKSRSSSRKSSRSKSKKSSKKSRKKSRSKSVSIREGDTLSEIAERNHTTVSKLRKLNGIKGNNIRAGKKLKVK